MEEEKELIVFDGKGSVTDHVCRAGFGICVARAKLEFSLHPIEIRLQSRSVDKATVAGARNQTFRLVRLSGEADKLFP